MRPSGKSLHNHSDGYTHSPNAGLPPITSGFIVMRRKPCNGAMIAQTASRQPKLDSDFWILIDGHGKDW